jgi:hypothetical protein
MNRLQTSSGWYPCPRPQGRHPRAPQGCHDLFVMSIITTFLLGNIQVEAGGAQGLIGAWSAMGAGELGAWGARGRMRGLGVGVRGLGDGVRGLGAGSGLGVRGSRGVRAWGARAGLGVRIVGVRRRGLRVSAVFR